MIFLFFFLFLQLQIQITHQATNYILEDLDEYPAYAYYSIKYFVIYPIADSLHDCFTLMPLLPDAESLQHFDFFGNFCAYERDILDDDPKCMKMRNFTETFKVFVDHLSGEDCSKGGWDDPAGILHRPEHKFNHFEFSKIQSFRISRNNLRFDIESQEESSDKWEIEYSSGFMSKVYGFDGPVNVQDMPKTFTSFPCIDVPLRKRFAVILETYLVDLVKTWYPFIMESKLKSFEDFLALVLFHLYVKMDDKRLNRIYTWQVIEDLKSMGTVLKLPKSEESFNRLEGLRMLLDDVLTHNLRFTFLLFLHSKIPNGSSSSLIKKVLGSPHSELIKLFLNFMNRNAEILDIESGYDGRLCHALYWSPCDWLFKELLKYKDVDWDAPDSTGYTVLGHMVRKSEFDERYRLFLKATSHFHVGFNSNGIERNVLDQCLLNINPQVGKSRFNTFLTERHKKDDFTELLVSAALHDRLDYFDLILGYRLTDSYHELDSAFKIILQYTGLDEPYLYFYAARILETMQAQVQDRNKKGNELERLFFMKWEIQLGRWRAAADEINLIKFA